MPLFSIITVCYNAAGTIERTIVSVDEQTFGDYEHFIVDGKSSDSTLSIIKSHPDSRRNWVSERDGGIYDAMNKGMSKTSGDYLIFLNAGDKFHSADTLAVIAKAIEEHSRHNVGLIDTVFTDYLDEGATTRNRRASLIERFRIMCFYYGTLPTVLRHFGFAFRALARHLTDRKK